MSSYVFKLLCLSLATFAVVYAAVGSALFGYSRRALRQAEKMDSHAAASYILFLRLLPAGSAALVVLAFCVPSYLWFEPDTIQESVNWGCWIAAALGTAIWTGCLVKGVRGTARHLRFVHDWAGTRHEKWLPGEIPAVWVLKGTSPLLALCGVFRSRIVVSEAIVAALPERELAMVLRHEQAHRASRDNLKRLVLLWTPNLAAFASGFRALDLAWEKFTEWAADDRAAAGDPQQALALAEALVRVARMGATCQPSALVNNLTAEGFSIRVDRLLREPARAPALSGRRIAANIAACVVLAGLLLGAFLKVAALSSAHRLLENLIR